MVSWARGPHSRKIFFPLSVCLVWVFPLSPPRTMARLWSRSEARTGSPQAAARAGCRVRSRAVPVTVSVLCRVTFDCSICSPIVAKVYNWGVGSHVWRPGASSGCVFPFRLCVLGASPYCLLPACGFLLLVLLFCSCPLSAHLCIHRPPLSRDTHACTPTRTPHRRRPDCLSACNRTTAHPIRPALGF